MLCVLHWSYEVECLREINVERLNSFFEGEILSDSTFSSMWINLARINWTLTERMNAPFITRTLFPINFLVTWSLTSTPILSPLNRYFEHLFDEGHTYQLSTFLFLLLVSCRRWTWTLLPFRQLTTHRHKEIVSVLCVFHLHLIVNFHFLPTVFHISPLFIQFLFTKELICIDGKGKKHTWYTKATV